MLTIWDKIQLKGYRIALTLTTKYCVWLLKHRNYIQDERRRELLVTDIKELLGVMNEAYEIIEASQKI